MGFFIPWEEILKLCTILYLTISNERSMPNDVHHTLLWHVPILLYDHNIYNYEIRGKYITVRKWQQAAEEQCLGKFRQKLCHVIESWTCIQTCVKRAKGLHVYLLVQASCSPIIGVIWVQSVCVSCRWVAKGRKTFSGTQVLTSTSDSISPILQVFKKKVSPWNWSHCRSQ